MPITRTALFISFAALALTISSPVAAASPLDEALSAIKSLFTTQEPPPPARQTRADAALAAYADAVRLRDDGDTSQAVRRLSDAADAGHAGAAYELGMLYTQGRVVAKDLTLAARWLNQAADLGDARAQYLVGANLMSGTGGDKDPSRGVGFLARAGEQGHARAQYLLGQAYVDGVGVAANPAWAARWYGRAAHAGHADAQYAYGVMRGSGLGLPRSARDAYRWLLLAAENGQRRAGPMAEGIAKRLSAQTTAEVHAEVAGFVPKAQAKLNDVPTVLFVQFALHGSGYDPGPLDGLVGSRTRSGIRAFEGDIGAAGSGQITDALLEQLITSTSRSG